MDFAAAKQVLAALEREGVRYALFGAAALNLHGLARFTEVVNVVSPRTLYRMERNTVRLRDRADAALLKERFGLDEEA